MFWSGLGLTSMPEQFCRIEAFHIVCSASSHWTHREHLGVKEEIKNADFGGETSNPLKTKCFENNIEKFSSYLTGNTLRLRY
jgi:hypothetical protein